MGYSYRLHQAEHKASATYTRGELELLATQQLKEVCQNERLAAGMAYRLERWQLIETIMRFRGSSERFLIDKYIPSAFERILKLPETAMAFSGDGGSIRV
jgi:hypothetical protein